MGGGGGVTPDKDKEKGLQRRKASGHDARTDQVLANPVESTEAKTDC